VNSLNKSFEQALLVNMLFVLLFIFSQYFTWTQLLYIHEDFGPNGISVVSLWSKGFYGLIGVGNSLQGQAANQTGTFGEGSYYPNFDLFVFVLAIAYNLYLVHGIGKEEKRPPEKALVKLKDRNMPTA
jgi:hypothetical protein